ncbi:hypothetical protein Dimus_005562 [Dionaea muscipula]
MQSKLRRGHHLKSPVSWHHRSGSDEWDQKTELGSFQRSPSLFSTIPDLGDELKVGLPPIAEVRESFEELRPPVVVSVRAPVGPFVGVVKGSLSDGREGEKDLGSPLVAKLPPDFDFDGSPKKEDGSGSELGDDVEGSRGVLGADAHDSLMAGGVADVLRAAPDMVSSSSSHSQLLADGAGLEPGSAPGAGDVQLSREAMGFALCTEVETVSYCPPSPSCVAASLTSEGVEIDLAGQGINNRMQVVDGGVGGDALTLPTELDCSCLPSVPTVPICSLLSDVDTASDDGLPPSSLVEPESVEKEKGILGGAFIAQMDYGELRFTCFGLDWFIFVLGFFSAWFLLWFTEDEESLNDEGTLWLMMGRCPRRAPVFRWSDLEDPSSSEEGDQSEMAVTTSEAKDNSDGEGVSSAKTTRQAVVLAEDLVTLEEIHSQWCSPEVDGKLENLSSEPISVSPLSPTSATMFCQGGVSSFSMPDSVGDRDAVRKCAAGGRVEVGRLADDGGLGGNGLVSEEGRVSPVAGQAVRPQPTDGLWQPPSASVEPMIVGGDEAELSFTCFGLDRFIFILGFFSSWFLLWLIEDEESLNDEGTLWLMMSRCPRRAPVFRWSDLEELSSSEEGDQSEMAVKTSEAKDTSDGEGGKQVPSPVIDLSPILVEASSISGSLSFTPSPLVNIAAKGLMGGVSNEVGDRAAVRKCAAGGIVEVSRLADGGGLGGDGLVSEEGRVSPVAGEVARPQPTDGLW